MTIATGRERSPLRDRDFALVWSGSLVSDTGDWLLMIALPLYVFAATGSALGASTVFIAELLPVLLFGPVLGMVVDHFDHRRVMIALNLAQGVTLLPLLLASTDRLWIVYLVAAVQAGLAAGLQPVRQALLPRLMPTAQLGAANSLVAVSDNLARLVGSPLGGIVFATLGLGGVVAMDVTSYLVSAVLLSAARVDGPSDAPAAPTMGFWRDLAAGLATIRTTPALRIVLLIECIASLAQGVFLVLFVVFVVRILGANDTEVGLLRGVQAIGGILGGLVVGMLIRRLNTRTLIGWGFVVFGLIALVTWNLAPVSTVVVVYVALFVAMGIPAIATTAGTITLVQGVTPPGSIGRVVATMGTLGLAAQGLGLVASGVLADSIGVLPILDAQAALYLVCGLLALLFLRLPVPAASTLP
ncbi:MFS transporter [Glaciihabitans sp. INWT7]|uniref:MFS transporter n=1 Tax=Glaciihabitans sp. INWT7 TaxID=2596912 RepID=UPI0016235009|nr:MFS transporter [Glaciihabitans sp. INWT7]QNE47424.1 MFS transporter [Glaciihabitans sp. INWT7]